MPGWFVKAWTDAGWCWGGSWQDIKDPMHFSYQGPLFDPGYVPEPPVPARTGPATFTRAVTFGTALGPQPEGATLAVADMDRDGALDAVQVRTFDATGRLFVEAAVAGHGFETCWSGGPTSTAAIPGATLLLADGTSQGRPDLWEIDGSQGQLSVTIHTFTSGFSQTLPTVNTGIGWAPGDTVLVGDHNRDKKADLYVIRPTDTTTTLQVWQGPDFATKTVEATLAGPITATWRFALGDRNLDGVPDLYAISPDNPAQVAVISGADGFTAPPETMTTAITNPTGAIEVGDLDGDGRDDIYTYNPNGTITAYLGGEQGATPDTNLTYWFYENHDRHWTPTQGCPADPGVNFRNFKVAAMSGVTGSLYFSPPLGQWVAAGLSTSGASWIRRAAGVGVDLETIATANGNRFAVLRTSPRVQVDVLSSKGALVRTITYGSAQRAADLVVVRRRSTWTLGALVDRGSTASMWIRSATTGASLVNVSLGTLDPIAAVAVDPNRDGNSDLVVLGTLADGSSILRVVTLAGRVVASKTFPIGTVAASIAVVTVSGRPSVAVMLNDTATGLARVSVVEPAHLNEQASHSVPAGAAMTGLGTSFVLSYADGSSGPAWYEGRDAIGGGLLYQQRLRLGFEPATAAPILGGGVVLGSQRRFDGTVLTERRDAAGRTTAKAALFYLRPVHSEAD
jgi:hypothetical protein